MNMKRDFHNPPQRRVSASLGTLLALLFLSSCGSWFADDKESSLDGECVGKDYNVLNDLIAAPFQNCNDSSECPSGSYCESDSNVHHTAASGAICYWQCYSDSDCGFGNHCDCNGLCEALDGDAGPGVDPSCPRSEGLLASIEPGVHYESVGAENEWQMQETVAPVMDTVGTGCSFSNLTTGGVPGGTINSYGILGLEAEGLEGRLAWSVPNGGTLAWRGPQSYLECDQSTSLDLDGASKAVRIAFKIPTTTTLSYIGTWQHAKTLAGKRDGLDAIDPSQGSGWDISFNELNAIRVVLFDGSGTIDIRTTATAVTLSGGNYNDGEWHFVEMVVDYSGAQPTLRARSDLDPGYEVSIDPTWNLSNSAPFRIGSFPSADSGTPRNMQVTYVSSFAGAAAEAMVNLSTPDNTFWDSAEPFNGRSCTYNEDCPYGSKCDDDTKLCSFSCLGTDHPEQGCTGAQVCDCFGDCVEPGSTPVRQNIDMPFMEVMPRDIPVKDEVFEPRRVSVNLVTEVPAVALASTTIPVTITAPPDLEVSCDAESSTTGSYFSSCILNSWSFALQGPRQRAVGDFWVRSIADTTSTETDWTIKLTSGGTAEHIAYVTVREHDVATPTDVSAFQQAGEFQGVLMRAAVGDNLGLLLPTETMPLRVPVRAWVTGTTIDFFDDTYSISPSGWLRIDSTQDLNQELLRLPNSGVAMDLATGGIDGIIAASSVTRSIDAVKGKLTGAFVISSVGSSRWEYTVTSFGGTACVATSECSIGEECSQGYCMPTPAWSPAASTEFSEERGQRWSSSFSSLVTALVSPSNSVGVSRYLKGLSLFGLSEYDEFGTPLSTGLYGVSDGISRAPDQVVPIQVAEYLLMNETLSIDFGVQQADRFNTYLYSVFAMQGQTNDLAWGIELEGDKECAGLACFPIDEEDYYESEEGFDEDLLRNNYIPCHDRFPVSGANLLFSNIVEPSLSSVNLRATCQGLYENHKAALSPNGFMDYQTFVSSQCAKSIKELYVTDLGTLIEEKYAIYLCPFRPAVFAGISNDPKLSAEKLLCYKPSNEYLPLQSDGPFGTEAMGVTGDLKCSNGGIPYAVRLANYADLPASEQELSTSEMLASCLSDLESEPPQFSDPMNSENAFEQFSTLFGTHQCFSPANFYSALGVLTAGMNFSLANWPLQGFGAVSDGPARQRLLTRLLQQWTTLHTFVAREGRQVESMAKTLRHRIDLGVVEQSSVDAAPGYEQLLDESERGWQLLLSFNNIVANFQDEDALVNPDYRPAAQQTGSLDHDQNIGLPVMVMEGLAAHMQLVHDYVRNVQVSAYGNCFQGGGGLEISAALTRARRAMHYANAVSRTWGTLSATITGVPSWNERYEYSQLEFQSARESAWRAIRDLTHCLAPGTISETDVPLFFGDVVGTSSRYFASSDYLLSGWAVPAVQSAISSLNQARSAFISQRNSQLQDQMSEVDAERRLEQLAAQYGGQIAELCGISEVESADVLNRIDMTGFMRAVIGGGSSDPQYGIDIEDCFIDHANPICTDGIDNFYQPTTIQLTALPDSSGASASPTVVSPTVLTDVQIRFALCRNEQLTPYFGNLAPEVGDNAGLTVFNRLSENSRILTEYVDGRLYRSFSLVRTDDDRGLTSTNSIGDNNDPIYSSQFFQWESDVANLSNGNPVAEAAIAIGTASCVSDPYFNGKSYGLAQAEETRLDPSCYRGVIGEAIASLITAHSQIESARANVERIGADIDLAQNNCEMTMDEQANINVIQANFANAQERRIQIKEQADRAFGFIDGLVSVATNKGAGFGSLVNLSLSYLHDRGVAVPGLPGFSVSVTEKDLREEQLAHDELMAELNTESTYQQCIRLASAPRTQFRGAYINIRIAQESAQSAIIRLKNSYSTLTRLAMEGRAAVNREEGRFVASYAHHYWLDEHVDAFERDFSYAKRLTFMALKSVEYEFQQSLALRQDILSASSPEQLQDAIVELKQEQVTRTINSRRPEDSQLVLSLRDDILLISESQSMAAGERDWTPTERFVDRLWSSENAVVDTHGEYLGQGITFNLEPTGALDYRCGERLWGLTATMQGDLLDVEAPNTSLFLIRKNSFGSQWCDGRGDESSLQVASIQPTSSLFEEDERGGTEAFGLSKITAMLQPWFNVPRSEFYKESYSEGASEEFAGRGLYGEYTILFPWKGLLEDGFPLEQVEDILIRFDYISVDNLTNL